MARVAWLDWSKESFEKAEKSGKLVLLDIFGNWCHWCHQMEKTYKDPKVAKEVMDNFVPVKVDTDQRPDINSRYNMGGWPTTLILTPDGFPVIGSTYLQPESMINFLRQGMSLYRTQGARHFEKNFGEKKFVKEHEMHEDAIKMAKELIESYFDPVFGGFGKQTKFPMFELLYFIVGYLERKDSEELKNVLSKTLKSMSESAVFDNIEGGFFRYSVTRDWNTPHYEKLLEDNARLLEIFLRAYMILGDEELRKTAEKTLEYIVKNLYSPKTGTFYSSQDADENYYRMDEKARKKNGGPAVDRVFYTDKNSMMIASLVLASKVLKESKYLKSATRCLEFLLKNCLGKRGVLHSPRSRSNLIFSDHVHLIRALSNIHGKEKTDYLPKIERLVRLAVGTFQDDDGLFFDLEKSGDSIGLMRCGRKNIIDNLDFALSLLRLGNKHGASAKNILKKIVLKELEVLEIAKYGESIMVYLSF